MHKKSRKKLSSSKLWVHNLYLRDNNSPPLACCPAKQAREHKRKVCHKIVNVSLFYVKLLQLCCLKNYKLELLIIRPLDKKKDSRRKREKTVFSQFRDKRNLYNCSSTIHSAIMRRSTTKNKRSSQSEWIRLYNSYIFNHF